MNDEEHEKYHRELVEREQAKHPDKIVMVEPLVIRLLVTGDRNWTDHELIRTALTKMWNITQMKNQKFVVIHGGARGADSIAGEEAEALHVPVEVYKANWKEYGRAAGPIRNKEMLTKGKPTTVFAFHDNIKESRGTVNMIAQCLKSALVVVLYAHNRPEELLIDFDAEAWDADK